MPSTGAQSEPVQRNSKTKRAKPQPKPKATLAATIIVAVVAVGVLLASWLIARAERQRAREVAAATRA